MANETTLTYWDINGTSLNNLGFNISTLGSGRLGVPDLRGANVTVPYRRGEYYTQKVADARDVTLAMWVVGQNQDGTSVANVESKWQQNFDELCGLMWSESGLLTLTKRFYRPSDAAADSNGIVTAAAEVEFVRGLQPTFDNKGRARFTVTFHLPDPFFYGEVVEEEFTDETKVLTVGGDAITYDIELDMDPGTSFSNTSFTPPLSISSNSGAVIDVKNKTVGGLSANALLTTSDDNAWFALKPGSNTVVCDGEGVLTYQPAYF